MKLVSRTASCLLAAALTLPATPVCRAQSATPAPAAKANLPTLFVVGNLAGASPSPALERVFDPARIHVVESPAPAANPRTFINSGQWDQLIASVHPGDFVLIDFGADTAPQDQAPARGQSDRNAATRILMGYGDGTFDYLDPGTHKLELVHSYGWYLRRMVVDVIAHGGSPILCAPASSSGVHAGPPDASAAQRAVANESVPQQPGTFAVNAPPDGAAYVDPSTHDGSTYAEWAGYIANEQRIPLLDLSGSGRTMDDAGLRQALTALKPDPLAPYLAKNPS